MASESSPTRPALSVRRPRFKQVNLDPLSRVIYTQTLTALKPLRTTNLDGPKTTRDAVHREHRNQLSTLVSTITAADTGELNEQQKLALNLGKLAALYSKRLAEPLEKELRPPTAHTVARPTVARTTVPRKREVAPPLATAIPEKKIKDEPLDEDDEPGCSTMHASANETLSSLLAAQLASVREESDRVRSPITVARPAGTVAPPRPVTVARAAPGAPPVKVVVAKRNGAAARVVAVRRPIPGQTAIVRATVSPPYRPPPTIPTVPRHTVPAKRTENSAGSLLPPEHVPQLQLTLMGHKVIRTGQLSRRLQIHSDACYGCCEADKPEMHPPHACPFCGLMIEGAARLEHVKETHPDQYDEFTPFFCILNECDFRTTSRNAVKTHCMQVHTHIFDKWDAKGRFALDNDTECPLCPEPFPLRHLKDLRAHVKAMHDVMPTILCGTCCETCTTISDLFVHWVHSPFCDGNAKLLDCKQDSFLALFK